MTGSGPSRHIASPQDHGYFGSEADIRPQATGVALVANDPDQTYQLLRRTAKFHSVNDLTTGIGTMKIDGRCHCGYVTFEAEIEPDKTLLCNCTDCQTFSGSAFRVHALTRENAFRLLSGEPKIYVKTAESGTKRPQAFCPECGTHIYATTVGAGPKVYAIRFGSIRQRDQIVPHTQKWFRSAQPWVTQVGSMRKFETES